MDTEGLAMMVLEGSDDLVADLVEVCEERACCQGCVDESGDSQLELELTVKLLRDDGVHNLDVDAVDNMLLARLFTLAGVGNLVALADLDSPLLVVRERYNALERLEQDESGDTALEQNDLLDVHRVFEIHQISPLELTIESTEFVG